MKSSLNRKLARVVLWSTNTRLAMLAITLFIGCAIIGAPVIGSVERSNHHSLMAGAAVKGGQAPRVVSLQDDKYAKSPLSGPEASAKQGEPDENSELSTLTVTSGLGKPKGQLVRPNVAQGAAVTNEVEPNNTSATATPLVGARVKARGNVFPAADVDFYSFTATAGDRIYAATQTLFDASGSGDSVLDLLGTDGTTVIETDLNDGTFNASSSSIAGALIPSSGTFFLRVRHNTATGTIRPYDLYLT